MKRFFLASAIMLAIAANFSFTTLARGEVSSNPFKRYTLTILNIQPVFPGSPCNAITIISFSFNWNGPLTLPTGFQWEGVPSFTIQCPGSPNQSRQSPLTSYQFDSQTGHFTSATFAPTGHATIDGKLSDAAFIQDILDDINEQIDAQK